MGSDNKAFLQDAKVGIIYGLIAALVNYLFLLPIYGQLYFHFGQGLVVLCLVLHQWRSGIIALAISTLSLSLIAGHALFIPILTFELLSLYALRKRGFSILNSTIIYWFLLGMPMAYVILQYITEFSVEYTVLASAKQFVNSIIYMLSVGILLMLLPTKITFKARGASIPTLSSYIYFMLNISIILPAVLVALILTTRNAEQQEEQIQKNIQAISNQFSYLLNTYLSTHINIVEVLATNLPNTNNSLITLDNTISQFPGFLSMLITDKEGLVISGAPSQYYQKLLELPTEARRVNDREYFRVPQQSAKDYISNAFVGRGFGDDVIVAISSPVTQNGIFQGIVEGSLNLPKFGDFEIDKLGDSEDNYIIVTDANNQVVYSSSVLNLTLLDSYTPRAVENFYSDKSKMLLLNDRQYLFESTTNDFKWQVYVLTTPDKVIGIFTNNMLILVVTVLIIFGVFMFITKRFAAQITYPLTNLINSFEKGIPLNDTLFTTIEIKELSARLSASRDVMDSFNKQLEEQVDLKTIELSRLNDELLKLSHEDKLTSLCNRRSFDQQAERVIRVNARNRQAMAIAIIDIDNFKFINDNYGHDVGDKCLVETAKLMRENFNRASDICARYGGDELVLLLSAGSKDTQFAQLSAFLSSINSLNLESNDKSFTFSVSVGVAIVENNFDVNLTMLLKIADKQLYESKRLGKNRISSQIV